MGRDLSPFFFFQEERERRRRLLKRVEFLHRIKVSEHLCFGLWKFCLLEGRGELILFALFVLGWASGVDFAGALSLESEPSRLAPQSAWRLLQTPLSPRLRKVRAAPRPRSGSWVGRGGARRGSCPLCWRPAATSPLGFLFLQLFRKDWK